MAFLLCILRQLNCFFVTFPSLKFLNFKHTNTSYIWSPICGGQFKGCASYRKDLLRLIHRIHSNSKGIFSTFLLIIYREEGRGIKELETSMREKHRSAAFYTLPTGDVSTTKVHALDRNRTWDPSVHRLTLYPLSQTGFGPLSF